MAFSRQKYKMKKVKILLKRFDRMESAMDRSNSTNDQVTESAGKKGKLKSLRVCLKRFDYDSALIAIPSPNVENEDQVPDIKISKNIQTDGQLRQYPPRTLRTSVRIQAKASKEQVAEAQHAPGQLPTTHIKSDINDVKLRQYPPRTSTSSVGTQAQDSKEPVTEAQHEPCQLATTQMSLQPTTENDGPLERLLCKFHLPHQLRAYSDETSRWYCSRCKCLLKGTRLKRVPWRRNRHPCLMRKRYFAQSLFVWGHLMRDHGLPLECAKCANQFYTAATYLGHKSCAGPSKPTMSCATSKKHFSRLERYRCAVCAGTFRTLTAFRGDLGLHNESPTYQCSLRDCAFLSHAYLKYHLGLVHSLAQYRCCSRKICTKHRLSCHSRRHSLNVRCGQLKRIPSQRGKRGQAYCAECNRCLNPKNAPVKLRNIGASNAKSLGQAFRVAQFRCAFCWQEFAFKSELVAHSLTHRRRGLRCGLCDGYFPNKSSLSEHIVGHLETETFQCAQCDHVFAQRAQLVEHLSTEHFGSVAKSCYDDTRAGLAGVALVAPKTELDDPSLDQHAGAVEGFGFSCAVCAQHFTSKLALKDHLSLHSKGCIQGPRPTSKQPKMCDIVYSNRDARIYLL